MTTPTDRPHPTAPDAAEALTGVPAARLPRDAAHWAGKVSRLQADPRSPAKGDNVTGRKLMGPVQGFGKMWQKTYTAALGTTVTPEQAIAAWKADFGRFWPRGNAFHGSLAGIVPGDVALLDLAMPGGARVSTGVMVLYADEESFTLMTPQGHMFAGWITGSAFEQDGSTVVQAQVLMRANDPLYEVGLTLGGHSKEDRFWCQTLTALGAHLGVHDAVTTTRVVCVDKHRQWRRAGNVWHNAAVRTALSLPAAPLRQRRRRRAEHSARP